MVLFFGFPESPFAQPRNVFFGHLVTALIGVIFVNLIPLPTEEKPLKEKHYL